MQQGSPVPRNFALRPGRRLIGWMGIRRRKRKGRRLDHRILPIVVKPIFARLKAGDDRMPALVCVLRGMLARRGVAATDMPALGTSPQVQPPRPVSQALSASISARRRIGIDPRIFPFHSSHSFPGIVPFSSPRCADAKAHGSAVGLPPTQKPRKTLMEYRRRLDRYI
jgi:hypothetical protein